MPANFEISLPDSLVKALDASVAELPRKTLEAIVAQSYRAGKISHLQVGEALGLDRWQTDAFLKLAQAHRPREGDEYAGDLEKLRNLTR